MSYSPSATSSTSTITGATENNQRLFIRFRKVFSENNPREFAQFAQKLAKWLGDRKAYYKDARPEIIRLLLAAETTLRAALNVQSQDLIAPFNIYEHPPHPLIPPYKLMVETVCQFKDLFEPSLQGYIQRMQANITPPAGHPSSSGVKEHLSGSESTLPPQTIPQTTQQDPDIQVIEKPQPPQTPTIQSPAPAAMSAPPAGATAPVRTRKVKKRKTLDFDALAQADIDALLQEKQAKAAESGSAKAEPPAKSPSVAPASQSAGPSNVVAQSAPASASGDHVHTPIDLTRSDPLQMPQESHSGSGTVPPPSPPAPSAAKPTDSGIRPAQAATSTNPSRTTTPVAHSQPVAHDTAMEVDSVSAPSIPQTVAPPIMLTTPAPVGDPFPRNPEKRPEVVAPPTPVNPEPPSQNETRATSTSEARPMEVDNVEQSQPLPTQVEQQAQGAMDVDNDQVAVNEAHVQTQSRQKTSPLPEIDKTQGRAHTSGSPMQIVGAPVGNVVGSRAPSADNGKEKTPSTERFFHYPAGEVSDAIQSKIEQTIKSMTLPCDRPTADMFAGANMRVIALVRGPSKGSRIKIDVNIEKDKFSGIGIWRSRFSSQKPSLGQLEHSGICISLGCYSAKQIRARSEIESCDTIEKQLVGLQPIWPVGGQVNVDVVFEGKRERLPLAPPFQVTPDNFVDISQFAIEGNNTLQLSHNQDLSRYTFVLLVHNPTQAQLKQLREQCKRDDDWTAWVADLTKPFSLPLQPPTTTPMSM